MRKRLIAVAAVLLLAIGAWLGNLFKGFGLGGPGSGTGEETSVNLAAPTDELPPQPPEPETPVVESEPSGVLTIVVESDQFRIQSGADADAAFAPTTLDDIVARAKESTGDEHGVRVRLRFHQNAQNGAISDLYKALQEQAVLDREAIIEAPGYVD
jgi:glycine/D-amino acid oxidase-like deaminating enzyme